MIYHPKKDVLHISDKMEAKFDFYEIAKICSSDRLKKFNGLECTIIGRSYDEEADIWYYAINVHKQGKMIGSCAHEDELKKTGKFASRDDYKSVGSIRVLVLPDGSGVPANEDGIQQANTFKDPGSNIYKKSKNRLVKYSKFQFGRELKERVSRKEDIHEIAVWAYSVYLEDSGEDEEFHELLSILASMDQGPDLMLSHKKLDEIAMDLCSGKEIDLDGLPS